MRKMMAFILLAAVALVFAKEADVKLPVVNQNQIAKDNGDWYARYTDFTADSRGIKYVSAVNADVIWASAYDGTSANVSIQEFTKTTDGGETWNAGTITATTGGDIAMIQGLSETKAVVAIHSATTQGIYMTTDGGDSWTRQESADFNLSGSFPNVVHFFDENNGFAQGDPVGGYYELYTTTDGGENWTRVPTENIPAPISGEWGVVGYYDAIGDNIWFGTNKGRVYRSNDKGYNWEVAAIGMADYTDLEFKSATHGIACFRSSAATDGKYFETFDGGASWAEVTPVGPYYNADIAYVPGTANTWVCTGSATDESGASYSFDGGHTWEEWATMTGTQMLATEWFNNTSGWAGGFSNAANGAGMFIFDGTLGTSAGNTVIVFEDDFENGVSNWTLDGTWGTTTETNHSPSNSLTESPNANYQNDVDMTAMLTNGVDLSDAAGAELNFWFKSDIETGFDYMYLDLSTDGTNWQNLKTYDEEDGDWTEETISLAGFVGNSDVKIRFRFVSDGGYVTVGYFIDDVVITTTDQDTFPPFISHQGPAFYEGSMNSQTVSATILDYSNLSNVKVEYTADNGATQNITMTNSSGDIWTANIPHHSSGVQIDYKIVATDAMSNTGMSTTYSYIEGNHIIQDNGIVDFYSTIEPGAETAAAVFCQMPAGYDRLDFALIRNYTDNNNVNSPMMFYVWEDDFGFPGSSLITPFQITAEATPQNTSAMTRVDLRPYASQLKNLDSFYIGIEVIDGPVYFTMTNPGNFPGSSFVNGASGWSIFESTSGEADFHFRAIVSSSTDIEETVATTATIFNNYPNPFNPTTTLNFVLNNAQNVKLSVYNSNGEIVANITKGFMNAGAHTFDFDASQLASGIYYAKLLVGNELITRKMVLIK
ncbi:MAG: T9SS type A sorting domain-containing protein [Candidatus Delongbacteria bacterium]|nr:T9SS type A sorting domain-containing protein [Candidatus Delongbacteria bacterium]MBN2833946.1 T9SS type A sorting domain-containing protein [Candidatus Delongbacteria bacterium]